jgi:CspA family cold shock protein
MARSSIPRLAVPWSAALAAPGARPNSAYSGRIVNLARGTVKLFFASKGYGIITPHDGGKDVFVHLKDVERSGLTGLRQDQVVEFERETDKRSGNISAIRLKPA